MSWSLILAVADVSCICFQTLESPGAYFSKVNPDRNSWEVRSDPLCPTLAWEPLAINSTNFSWNRGSWRENLKVPFNFSLQSGDLSKTCTGCAWEEGAWYTFKYFLPKLLIVFWIIREHFHTAQCISNYKWMGSISAPPRALVLWINRHHHPSLIPLCPFPGETTGPNSPGKGTVLHGDKPTHSTSFETPSYDLGFPDSWVGKESACNAGDPGLIPGLGRSPGEGMATHSSFLAWRIPWTG